MDVDICSLECRLRFDRFRLDINRCSIEFLASLSRRGLATPFVLLDDLARLANYAKYSEQDISEGTGRHQRGTGGLFSC